MKDTNHANWRTEQLAAAGYNWDSFADLLIQLDIKDIASDLLYLYFQVTDFHARNSDVIGNTEQFSGALFTLRELYRTFEELGKKGDGTLKLTR